MTKRSIFQPEPWQVDFSDARYAPIINCVLKCQDKILVVQRSQNVGFYPGYWNGISGFLDDKQDFSEKVAAEMEEEIGISKEHIQSIKTGEIFHQEASDYGKTWIVHPVLVEVDTDEVKLDWEAKNYQWIKPAEAGGLDLLPGFGEVLEKLGLWPAETEPVPEPGRYRHFKGGEYQVWGVARHSETGEWLVVYQALDGEKELWVRPLAMFGETVERDGKKQPRFLFLEDDH